MNILKKIICCLMIAAFAAGFTACNNNANKPAVEFPYAELNEIYDSEKDSKEERFDKKNLDRRYIVKSAEIKNVIFKSSTEYDVFCFVKSGERTFNFRLYVDLSLGEITKEYIDSLEKGDIVNFEGTFLSQTQRGHLSSFKEIKFLES